MADILGDEIFVRSRAVVARVVAGETLIVPVRAKVGDLASIYSFNGTGSLIWKLLEVAANRGATGDGGRATRMKSNSRGPSAM